MRKFIHLFVFDNDQMAADLVDAKGKILSHKKIGVNAFSETEARAIAYRPNQDTSGTLDPEWKLTSMHVLSNAWRSK